PANVEKQQSTPEVPGNAAPADGAAESSYGIQLFGGGSKLAEVQASLSGALQQLAGTLGKALEHAATDAANLAVKTYVSDQMDTLAYVDTSDGGAFAGARLRARTRIGIAGDTLVCVPEKDGQVDQAIWSIHLEMVQRAQAHRAELLKTAVSAATGLL